MAFMPQQRAIRGMKSVGVFCLLTLYLLHWPGVYFSPTMRWTLLGVMALTLAVAIWEKIGPASFFRGRWGWLFETKTPATWRYAYLATLTLFLFFSGYAYLQYLDPNYFNQDDNFAQFGPVILVGVKSLLRHGVFPNWNPYQFMGAPVADVGTYALTYPPTYLSVGVASAVFHSPALWTNVFFVLHAVPAILVMLHLLRILGVTPALNVAATLAYVFCGYNLIAGRSWFYMIPVMLTLPLLAWLLVRLDQFASRRWLWTAALSAGVSFHAGNSQMWFYWVLFLGLGILLRLFLEPELPRRAIIVRSFCAFGIGLGIAFPLLLPQLQFVATVKRFPLGLGHIADNLGSLFLPFPLLDATYPSNWAPDDTRIGQLYYASSVFTLVAAGLTLAVYIGWLRKRDLPLATSTRLFLGLGAIAFLLCLGEFGVFWRVLSYLPPFSLFSHPFKLILYLHFFWIVAAAHFLSHIRIRSDWAIAAVSVTFTAYHLSQCTSALYRYADREYHPLPTYLSQAIHDHAGGADYVRIDDNSPLRSHYVGYVHSLTHHFAMVYGLAGVWGYDPLVLNSSGTRELNNFWEHARCVDPEFEYPHWVAKRRFKCNGSEAQNPGKLEELLRRTGTTSRLTYARDGSKVKVRRVLNPDPIVFAEGMPALTHRFRADFSGVEIENSQPASGLPVVVNFMWRQRFVASADGQPVALTRDQWGRTVAHPPANWKRLTVRYQPQWAMACGLGLVFFLSGLVASIATRKFR